MDICQILNGIGDTFVKIQSTVRGDTKLSKMG